MRKIPWIALLSISSVLSLVAAGLVFWFSLHYERPVHLPAKGSALSFAKMSQELVQARRFPEALEANQQALSYQPHNPSLLYNQAWLYARLGKLETALNAFEKILEVEPQHVGALVNRSWLYKRLQHPQFRASLLELERLGIQGRNTLEKARILQLKAEHSQALELLEAELKQGPDPNLQYWRSQSYFALGQERKALADLSAYLAHTPDASAYRQRAQAHRRAGQLEAALSDLQRAQELNPGPEIDLEIARLYVDLNPEQALQAAQELQEDHPHKAFELSIQAMLAQRQHKEALEKIESELQRNPNRAQIWALKASILRQRRQYSAAEQALHTARTLDHPRPENLDLERARIAAQQGQREEAIKWLQNALMQQPGLRAELKDDRLLRRWL